MENGCGNAMKTKKIERTNKILKNRIRTLEFQLKSRKTSKNRVGIRVGRESFRLKCKIHELHIEMLEKKYFEKLDKLHEAHQEIANLKKIITQLQLEIDDNKRLMQNNDHVISQQETIIDTQEANIPEINNIYHPIVILRQTPRDELENLYSRCRKAVEDNMGNLGMENRNRPAGREGAGREDTEREDAESEPQLLGTINNIKNDKQNKEIREDYENMEREGTSSKSQTCKWIANDGKMAPRICGKVFESDAELQSHFYIAHGDKRGPDGYACFWDGCKRHGVSFWSKPNFVRHVRCHFSENRYRCPYNGCDMLFEDQAGLDDHKRKGCGNVIPTACPKCSKVFTHRRTMLVHHRIKHEGYHKYKCTVAGCERVCHSAFALRKHTLVHTEEKKHSCHFPGCNTAFKYKKTLDSHYTKHYP